MITVALDAMGGDNGVQAAVEGAARLSLESAAISILLVGDVDEVSEILHRLHTIRNVSQSLLLKAVSRWMKTQRLR